MVGSSRTLVNKSRKRGGYGIRIHTHPIYYLQLLYFVQSSFHLLTLLNKQCFPPTLHPSPIHVVYIRQGRTRYIWMNSGNNPRKPELWNNENLFEEEVLFINKLISQDLFGSRSSVMPLVQGEIMEGRQINRCSPHTLKINGGYDAAIHY